MPHNIKHNKFQVNKFSAKLYTKSTGLKVDNHKIIGHDTTNKNHSIQGQVNEYYKAITVADQKQSICMGSVENPRMITSNNHDSNKIGKEILPSKYKILHNSTFGKPSPDHTFTSEASFKHVLIFLFKGRFLPESDIENLLNTHPLIRHFNKMIVWSYNTQFAGFCDARSAGPPAPQALGPSP